MLCGGMAARLPWPRTPLSSSCAGNGFLGFDGHISLTHLSGLGVVPLLHLPLSAPEASPELCLASHVPQLGPRRTRLAMATAASRWAKPCPLLLQPYFFSSFSRFP